MAELISPLTPPHQIYVSPCLRPRSQGGRWWHQLHLEARVISGSYFWIWSSHRSPSLCRQTEREGTGVLAGSPSSGLPGSDLSPALSVFELRVQLWSLGRIGTNNAVSMKYLLHAAWAKRERRLCPSLFC